MSPEAVVAIVKTAITILKDKKLRNFVGGVILGSIIIIFIPVCIILVLSSCVNEMDQEEMKQMVIEHLDEEQLTKLGHIDRTMLSIETAMTEAGYSDLRITEAQILFALALYEHSDDPGFVDKLVGCFMPNQTDVQLIASVNTTFHVTLEAADFTNLMSSVRAVYIDTSQFISPETKNNLDLVQWAKIAERKHWGYVWGTYGKVLDEALFNSKLQQYPEEIGQYEDFIRSNWLGGRAADCIGLIKGYCWFDPQTGNINYATNGMPDINANYMANSVAEKGTIDTMPEIPGLAVWHTGHIGIYIGEGKVIEARATQIGVVETNLADGSWTHWIKIPYIDYIEETAVPEETDVTPSLAP